MGADRVIVAVFPFIYRGAFIEAMERHWQRPPSSQFPYSFVGTFIEAETSITASAAFSPFPFLLGRAFNKTDQYSPDDRGAVCSVP